MDDVGTVAWDISVLQAFELNVSTAVSDDNHDDQLHTLDIAQSTPMKTHAISYANPLKTHENFKNSRESTLRVDRAGSFLPVKALPNSANPSAKALSVKTDRSHYRNPSIFREIT
jgi:hypothetical protein